MITHDKLFLGGTWVRPSNPRLLPLASPHDQTLLGRTAQALPAEIDEAVVTARAAFDDGPWPHTPPAARIAIMRRLDALRAERADEIARVLAAETGTPVRATRDGQRTLARQAKTLLTAAEEFGWDEGWPAPAGVVAAIVSWHAPFSAALNRIMPALLAGNTLVLKAAPENALSLNLLADLLTEAGVPDGVVSVLPAGRASGEYLIRHPDIDMVAFNGSARAGRRIAAVAGERLKRIDVAPAGRHTMVLLPGADPGEAVRTLVPGLTQARILAPRHRYAEVVAAAADLVASSPLGDPLDESTAVGPMPRPDLQQRVRDHVDLGVSEGARVVAGGSRLPDGLDKGNYVTPTVFAGVDHRMRVAREDVFGPVLTVIAYRNDHEAAVVANDAGHGFSATVWSADPDHAMAVTRRLHAGTVTINGAPVPAAGRLTDYVEHRTVVL
jgi:acyl-CoA reductase-like NAD-dependent aldehyde dehydrogenase